MMFRWLCLAAGLGLIYGQDRPARLTFEVASIKLSKQGERDGLMIKAMPGGQRYTAHNASLKFIFSLMYKVPQEQILSGPDWLDRERYDIEATADHSYSLDDLHIMFQNLLVFCVLSAFSNNDGFRRPGEARRINIRSMELAF
jgi:hypothetical protein